MGLRINTNVSSLAAQRQMGITQRKADGALRALASGNKFDDPNKNAADVAIAEHLRGQMSGVKAGRMNAENAYAFAQVAEGGLNEQNNILIRMRELAVQAASDTFSDDEREMLQTEWDAISAEFDRIAETTSFGSNKLLNGTETEYEFQVGAYGTEENRIYYKSNTNTKMSALNLDSARVSDQDDARDALDSIDEALKEIGKARANFGAVQSRLNSTINNAGVQLENLTAAHSRMADTDVAEAVSEVAKNSALLQYQVNVLSKANEFPGQVLRLIA